MENWREIETIHISTHQKQGIMAGKWKINEVIKVIKVTVKCPTTLICVLQTHSCCSFVNWYSLRSKWWLLVDEHHCERHNFGFCVWESWVMFWIIHWKIPSHIFSKILFHSTCPIMFCLVEAGKYILQTCSTKNYVTSLFYFHTLTDSSLLISQRPINCL